MATHCLAIRLPSQSKERQVIEVEDSVIKNTDDKVCDTRKPSGDFSDWGEKKGQFYKAS